MIFPRLPVIDDMVGLFGPRERDELRQTCVVCVQHLVESNGSMLEALVKAGVQPDHMFVGGKIYSTNNDVWRALNAAGINMTPHASSPQSWRYTQRVHEEVGELWRNASAFVERVAPTRLIAIDDGGFSLRSIPKHLFTRCHITGVEQTTSGVNIRKLPPQLPIIEVASSAAKRFLESPLIAAAVANKAARLGSPFPKDATIGVAGLGSVGAAVANHYAEAGHVVIAFDRNKARLKNWASVGSRRIVATTDIVTLVDNSDVVFGCTGADFLRSFKWNSRASTIGRKRVRLISCSSRDIEFLSVLDRYYSAYQGKRPTSFDSLTLNIGRFSIIVERGGYPINFDGSRESVPSKDIQLTRGLMLAGVLQALRLSVSDGRHGNNRIPLSATLQARVVSTWMRCSPDAVRRIDPALMAHFSSASWIATNSAKDPQYPEMLHGLDNRE